MGIFPVHDLLMEKRLWVFDGLFSGRRIDNTIPNLSFSYGRAQPKVPISTKQNMRFSGVAIMWAPILFWEICAFCEFGVSESQKAMRGELLYFIYACAHDRDKHLERILLSDIVQAIPNVCGT